MYNRYPVRYWTKLLPMPRKLKATLLDSVLAGGVGGLPVLLPAGNLAAFGFK